MEQKELYRNENVALEHSLIAAKRVTGSSVYNQSHTKIGKIEDIAIDKQTGKVAYAILSFGGFLGLNEKYHALPWSILTYSKEDDGYTVPITEEFLSRAPKFDVSDLSGWDDSASREAFYNYYGARPYW